MEKFKSKGFTIIELFIVISLICIIAAIVSVNLTNARNRDKDSLIKSNMRSLISKAELYFARNGNYLKLCLDQDFMFVKEAVNSQVDNKDSFFCNIDGKTNVWAICSYLPFAKKYWCIDSTGADKSQDEQCGIWTTSCEI